MKPKKMLFHLAVLAATTCVSGFTSAADKFDIGEVEYNVSCADCHGFNGEGNGPYAESLKSRVPDLTVLSRNNGGVFPVTRVYDAIDGRQLTNSHGRDMPIWGNRYSTVKGPHFRDDYSSDEAAVRGRILALIDYINHLQQK
jgi:mono/diheme cytochrome c family protein